MNEELKKAIKQCGSWEELVQLIERLDPESLQPRDVTVIHRALSKCEKAPDIKIAYLGDHTIDNLLKYVETRCAIDGLKALGYVGGFDQYFQEILEPSGGLHQFGPDIIFLSTTARALAPEITGRFAELSDKDKINEKQRLLDHLHNWVDIAKSNTDATLLVCNLARPGYPQAGIADSKLPFSEAEWYSEFNLELLRAFKNDPRVHLVDLDLLTARYGADRAFDTKMFYMAHMNWSEGFLSTLAGHIFRYIIAAKGLTKKCAVVDLDNTLWGGVVGEEGVAGVKVGKGHGEGEVYYDFQQAIRSLKARGIVLAIASKNNPDDATEVFQQRTEMPLSLDDFAATRINWEHKHKNIQEIASVLNIGTDSLVFIDDNPVERELIKTTMSEVATLELPQDPTGYVEALQTFPYFEKLSLTAEDITKLDQYKQNAQRQQHRDSIGDMKSFLESLETRLSIEQASPSNVQRVHQLFSKTNQFNVTTKRYSVPDIEKFITGTDWHICIASVKDKFGDLGVVGLYLLEVHEDGAVVDSFILSCRAMGRGIETAMMNKVKAEIFDRRGLNRMTARYLPTAKNQPVSDFMEKQGFKVERCEQDGAKEYVLEAPQSQLLEHPGIDVRFEGKVDGNKN